MRAAVILSISMTKGSDAVAMEIFEAAARRWRTILDDNYCRYFSVEELRRYPPDRLPFNGGPV